MGKRLIRRLVVATAGVAVLVLATPGVAVATPTASVSPKTVAPGDKIVVTVTCPSAGSTSVTVFWGRQQFPPHEADRTVQLEHDSKSVEFSIPVSTPPGDYVAGVTCPSHQSVVDHFRVAPKGAPAAGGGPSGAGGAVTLAGAGVLAVAAAAGAFILMRRRVDGPVS